MGRLKGYKLTEEAKLKISKAMMEWHKTHKHPRGMLGKHHSQKTRNKMSLNWEQLGHPRGMLGKLHSEEVKREMAFTRQGGEHWNWQGGLKELVQGIRSSPQYYQWKKAVLERDNHTCRDCGTTEKLDTHHIQSILNYPQGVFEVNNGLTLCGDCHDRHTFWQVLRGRKR